MLNLSSPILTISEAADYIKLAKGTLYQYIHYGKIPHYKIGNRVMFKKEDLDDFIEKCFIPVGVTTLQKVS